MGNMLELRSRYSSPITVDSLRVLWSDFIGDKDPSHEDRRLLAGEFMIQNSKTFIEALSFTNIAELCNNVLVGVSETRPLAYGDFSLNTKEPSAADLQDALMRIYAELSLTQKYREECIHYLGILRQCMVYGSSFKKSMTLLLGRIKGPSWFPKKGDSGTLSSRIKSQRCSRVNGRGNVYPENLRQVVEEVLSPRQNLLLRADLALRLLVKSIEIDFANSPKSHHGGNTSLVGDAESLLTLIPRGSTWKRSPCD